MHDWNAVTISALEHCFLGSSWDVIPGCDAPVDMAVCLTYPSVVSALAALETAGFAPARHSVPASGLADPAYDLTTMLKLSAGDGRDVVLVRRK